MTLAIRYLVDDASTSADFYRDHLGFEVLMNPAPGFAMLERDGTRLMLNAPGAGGAGTAGDGAPSPGGWNRFQLQVDDLDTTVTTLREGGCTFRGDVVDGNGGRQVLLEDPSGNPVELFEPHDD